MNKDQLNQVAIAMVAPGRGLLAADESTSTIKKRFDAIKVENTEDNRRDYREFMFRSAQAMKNHISGVILFDETIRQKAKDGTPLVKIIEEMGSLPGIKVDQSTHPLPGFPHETITEGLDGLPKRMKEYYDMGARFAKWRAVIRIGDGLPTWGAVRANMQALARYAAICQAADIVPIVEPEVLMDGAHPLERTYEVTEHVLKSLYEELYAHRVFLEGTILKPNMIVPGEDAKPATPEQVAAATIRLFKNCVPVAVPGIGPAASPTSRRRRTSTRSPSSGRSPGGFRRALQAAAQHAFRRLHPPRADERACSASDRRGGEEGGVPAFCRHSRIGPATTRPWGAPPDERDGRGGAISIDLDMAQIGEREHARPDDHVAWALRERPLDQLDHGLGDDPRPFCHSRHARKDRRRNG